MPKSAVEELDPAAHPRWRGAYQAFSSCDMDACGSSPLARGIWLPNNLAAISERLIPAGAGHIVLNTDTASDTQAHPRWRGAY